jgi:hypothetical protein
VTFVKSYSENVLFYKNDGDSTTEYMYTVKTTNTFNILCELENTMRVNERTFSSCDSDTDCSVSLINTTVSDVQVLSDSNLHVNTPTSMTKNRVEVLKSNECICGQAGLENNCVKEFHRCSESKINILYLNARSIKTVNKNINKINEFQNLIYTSECDVVGVSESWLDPTVCNDEILDKNNYVVYRRDRDKQRGGGVLLGIKKDIYSSQICVSESHEILAVEIKPSKRSKLLLVCCYRSPSETISDFVTELRDILQRNSAKFNGMCIVGDFNLPGITWNDCWGSSESTNDNLFLELCSDLSLSQVNNELSTMHGNILDLVLTNLPDNFSHVTKSSLYFDSDHFPLEFNIDMKTKRVKCKPRTILNYKKANFVKMNNELISETLISGIASSQNIETACKYLMDTLNEAIYNNVPTIKVNKNKDPVWFDKTVRHLRKCKNTAWRKYRRTKSKTAWSKYKKLRNAMQKRLKVCYKNYIEKLGTNVKENPKVFWSFIKSKTGKGSIPDSVKNDTKLFTESNDIAEAFNNHFYSMFSQPDLESNDSFLEENVNVIPQLCDIELTELDVFNVLKNLNCFKATGPDNIAPKVLKECRSVLSRPLCRLFNISLNTGTLPTAWRSANVVPIYKSGDKQLIKNYRPVSLLSVISKVFERCIFNKIYPFICNQINNVQHGFTKGRSTCTQLLHFVNDTCKTLDETGQTDIVYLDFEKAFDRVTHKLLLKKLQWYGIGGKLLCWFESYLTDRRQRVVINGVNSQWLPVLSGVPQGSIMGPLLFLLYIDDISSSLNYSKIMVFADDTKLYMTINSELDCHKLQADLNEIINWSKTWKMNLNVTKCKILTVTRKRNPVMYNYCMNNEQLERCEYIRDLGIIINNTLTWCNHVQSIVSKANKVMGLIKRTLGYNAPTSVSKQLYISLVRSILEYGTPVWSGMTVHDTVLIERVQRAATRFMLHSPDIDYRERLEKLEILPLTLRRDYLDLCMFFKYCKGLLSNINAGNYVTFINNNAISTRNSEEQNKILIPITNTFTCQKTFFFRIVFMWNSLAKGVRTCDKINIFKNEIHSMLMNQLKTHFDSNVVCTWHVVCRCNNCRLN